MDGPYRSAKIRGGVALPRRAQAWWQVAVGLAAFTWLLVVGSFAATELREETSSLRDRIGWFFAIGAAVLVVVGPLSSAIVTGRSSRTTRALGFALAPSLVVEVWATTRFPPWVLPSNVENPHLLGTDLVVDLASARVGCHAITSVAALTVTVACVGAVMGVRQECRRGPVWPSVLVAIGALAFAALRLRDWHRDGFVGALPVFGLCAAALLAPMLRGRVRALSDWHDPEERRATQQSAWLALVGLAVATLAAERALLAYEESSAVSALQRWATTFETRYELVHGLAGSVHAHRIALAILTVVFAIVIVAAAKELAPRHPAGWVPLVMVAVTVVLSVWTENRVTGLLVVPPGPPVPSGVALPRIEKDPSEATLVRPRRFLPLAEQAEPQERPVAFVGDRAQPTRHLFQVTRGWRGTGLGIVASGGPAPRDLGPWEALIGPRWVMVDVDLGTLKDMKRGRGLFVLDEGGTARMRVPGGPVRGMSLREDADARIARIDLRVELGALDSVIVAPSPTGDLQSFVDLLVAVQEVVKVRPVVTADYLDVQAVIDGR